jgi:hypothetical protein
MRQFVDEVDAWVKNNGRVDHSLLKQIRENLSELYGTDADLERLLDVIHDLSVGRKSTDVFKDLTPDAASRVLDLTRRLPQVAKELDEIDSQIAANQSKSTGLESEAIECINSKCEAADIDKAVTTYLDLASLLAGVSFRDGLGGAVSVEAGNLRGRQLRYLNVVTTNYDLCFESFCSSVGASWSTGFQSAGGDQEQTFLGAPQTNEAMFPILKLHGSIDWWRTDNNRVVRTLHTKPGRRLLDRSRISRMEIRYPIGSKDLFGDPYLRLYARFAEWLSSCPIWIFIGYSFGDPSIRQLVRESLRDRTKMYVIHPHADELERTRMSGLEGGKIYWIRDRFPSSQFEQVARNTAQA